MLTNKELFHSLSDPVPPLRRDVQIIPIDDNGKNLLYFHDSMGYLSENFALDAGVQPLLQMFNGDLSIEQIHNEIEGDIGIEQLLDFVQLMDQHRALQSEYLHFFADTVEDDFEKKSDKAACISRRKLSQRSERAQLLCCRHAFR